MGSGGRMAPREPLEVSFEVFCALLAECSQRASGDSFRGALGSVGRMAPREPLEIHFELFWVLVAEWLSGGLWRLILSCFGLWWQNGSQGASGDSF